MNICNCSECNNELMEKKTNGLQTREDYESIGCDLFRHHMKNNDRFRDIWLMISSSDEGTTRLGLEILKMRAPNSWFTILVLSVIDHFSVRVKLFETFGQFDKGYTLREQYLDLMD